MEMLKRKCELCSMEGTHTKRDASGLVHYYCDHHAPEGSTRINVAPIEDQGLGPITWKSYLPLISVVGVILMATIVLTVRDTNIGVVMAQSSISYFMVGFFLVFAMFKLMDLPGFAEGYSTYDLLASKWKGYGYIYPFIELFFGLSMLVGAMSTGLLWAEVIVMGFSGLGVAIKITKKEPFMCACLGTFLKVPLTKVTLIEDFGMMVLGIIMLFIS